MPGAPEQSGRGGATSLAVPAAIPPLNVCGLVVTKADLVAALRLYVPQLTDIAVLDGERFLLSLTPERVENQGEHRG